jgi:hypothetical protein
VAARVPIFRVFNPSGTLRVGLVGDPVGFRPIKVSGLDIFRVGFFKTHAVLGHLSGLTHRPALYIGPEARSD